MKTPDLDILKQHGWEFVPARKIGQRLFDEYFYHQATKKGLLTYNEVLDWIIDSKISK